MSAAEDAARPTPEATPPPPAAPQYEFTGGQGAIIGDLGTTMRLVGAVGMAVGVTSLLVMIVALVRGGVLYLDLGGLLYLLIGYWTLTAGQSFRDVAETRGRDISHLMAALGQLRKAYGLIALLLVFAMVLLIVALIVGWIAGARVPRLVVGGQPVF